jgi:hypothetical protein
VRRLLAIGLALTICGLGAVAARGETFTLTDNSTLDGELVAGSANEKGVILKLDSGAYSDRVTWERFSQDDLKKLAKNAKVAKFVQALIIEDEPTIEQKKRAVKPPITIKPVESRLQPPENPALIGGFFSSSVGWMILLLIYAANIWAAYEVAIFRAQPVGLLCGLAAVAPMVTQVVFLCLPTRMPKEEAAGEAAGGAPGEGGAEAEQKIGANLKIAYSAPEAEAPAAGHEQPAIFKRGEFMFNRRFFETRFGNFFGMIRRDKDKTAVLVIKTSRGEYLAQRITRIAASDMHIEVHKGTASEEIAVSFVEIQEVQLKHGH